MKRDSGRWCGEDGFTLVELMVVVLVLAILLALGLPTFLGARKRAADRAAQTQARQALTAAKVIYQASEDYSSVTVAALHDAEPSLVFVDATTASTNPLQISVDSSVTAFIAAVYSTTGTCFFLRDETVTSGLGTTFAASDGTACAAGSPPPDGDFSSHW